MTPWGGLAANRCGPFFVPIFPLLRPPIFYLSGGFFGGKVPEILPRTAPKTSPSEADSSSPNTLKSPWKAPSSCPVQVMIPPERLQFWTEPSGFGYKFCLSDALKGKKTRGIAGEKVAAKDALWKRRWMGEMQGILMGDAVCEDAIWMGKTQGRTSRGKWGKKLQKLSFLKLEIMLEMDIFRQTKWQNAQTKCSS